MNSMSTLILTTQDAMAVIETGVGGSPINFVTQNISSGSGSSEGSDGANDVEVVKSGYQIVNVSGAQACGGEGFNYSRFWVEPIPDGNTTKLNCVPGYRCEVEESSPIFWCKEYSLPLNGKCGGYLFYTLFKCIDGTACTIDPVRYEPRCIPVDKVSPSVVNEHT
ncbi:hypothetical protein F442_18366 [Phytophthora nicotianae P10297]|uniref:Uncharacterized protein n=1 Tax=Phytophthora nicotianae P10297 TaxID=1317064 RepID=W2YD93_PHYNI|nr:hypothetical protein F442_18366 [Phytophthora nicotianae P10297]